MRKPELEALSLFKVLEILFATNGKSLTAGKTPKHNPPAGGQ